MFPKGVSYQWEPLDDLLWDGLDDITKLHYNEVALDQEHVPLAPDWDSYRKMEKAGTWRMFTARDSGKLIGYISWFITKNLHYKRTTYCDADFFYLINEKRLGMTGVRLFREAEKVLPRPCKINIFTKIHIQIGKRKGSVGDLLQLLGYKPIEITYSKWVP